MDESKFTSKQLNKTHLVHEQINHKKEPEQPTLSNPDHINPARHRQSSPALALAPIIANPNSMLKFKLNPNLKLTNSIHLTKLRVSSLLFMPIFCHL